MNILTHLRVVGGGQRRVVVVGRVVEHVGGRRVGGRVRLAVGSLELAGWRERAAAGAGGRLRELLQRRRRPGRSVGQGPGLLHGQRTAARGGHARGAQGRGRLSMGHRSRQQRHRRGDARTGERHFFVEIKRAADQAPIRGLLKVHRWHSSASQCTDAGNLQHNCIWVLINGNR